MHTPYLYIYSVPIKQCGHKSKKNYNSSRRCAHNNGHVADSVMRFAYHFDFFAYWVARFLAKEFCSPFFSLLLRIKAFLRNFYPKFFNY